jgi:hypothetical protein
VRKMRGLKGGVREVGCRFWMEGWCEEGWSRGVGETACQIYPRIDRGAKEPENRSVS